MCQKSKLLSPTRAISYTVSILPYIEIRSVETKIFEIVFTKLLVNVLSYTNLESCVDRNTHCQALEGLCTTNTYVQTNCLYSCDSTCPRPGKIY